MSQNYPSKFPEYTPPEYQSSGFNCPHCGSYNQQSWYLSSILSKARNGTNPSDHQGQFAFALCLRCHNYSIWQNQNSAMIYPRESPAPHAHKDMPEDVLIDFNEAREIVSISPRGAAALLRLATEKLVAKLVADLNNGKPKKTINDNIGELVKNGLPRTIQKAADSLRVIGNEAVHAGVLDLKDDRETALRLFKLVNVIVENQISQVQEIERIYNDKIPANQKDAVEKRDNLKP